MKITAVCLILSLFSISLSAQEDTRGAQEVVENFFQGLNSHDTSLIRSTLYEDVELATVVKGSRPVKVESVDHFLKAIHDSKDLDIEERIRSYEIMQDEGMAVVWAPYEFFVNQQLSHCGVNAFTLILTEEGWKVHSIIDTRRREDCLEAE